MLFVLLLGAVCTREALLTDYMIASKVGTIESEKKTRRAKQELNES